MQCFIPGIFVFDPFELLCSTSHLGSFIDLVWQKFRFWPLGLSRWATPGHLHPLAWGQEGACDATVASAVHPARQSACQLSGRGSSGLAASGLSPRWGCGFGPGSPQTSLGLPRSGPGRPLPTAGGVPGVTMVGSAEDSERGDRGGVGW